MTFDECHKNLTSIRRKQGTRCPLVRIDTGGSLFQGRLSRTDSDPEHRKKAETPYGVLVLESPGLIRGAETIVQIADIADGGILDGSEN